MRPLPMQNLSHHKKKLVLFMIFGLFLLILILRNTDLLSLSHLLLIGMAGYCLILRNQWQRSQNHFEHLMEGLDEGIFFFDEKGTMSFTNKTLHDLLPGSDKLTNIKGLFEKFGQKDHGDVQQCLDFLWPAQEESFYSDFESSVILLPQQIDLLGGEPKTLKFSYRPVTDEHDRLIQVAVLVYDVSNLQRLKAEQVYQNYHLRRLSHAAGNIEAFKNFLEEMIGIIKSVDHFCEHPDMEQFNLLKQNLHTMKGSLGIFGFHELASKIHSVEDFIFQSEFQNFVIEFPILWNECKEQWKFETTEIEKSLGLHRHKNIMQVNRSEFQTFCHMIARSNNHEWQCQLEKLTQFPIQDALQKYCDHVKEICEFLEDKAVTLIFDNSSDQVSFEEIRALNGPLVHILRNCIDHGIETKDIRKLKSKPIEGCIHISCFRKPDGTLHLIIRDDGGGIDADALASKAVKKGFWTEEKHQDANDQEKINLIFAEDMSVRDDQVSEYSGRGVGMGAVKTELEKMGGSITVFSQPGCGTQFEIAFLSNVSRNKFLRSA